MIWPLLHILAEPDCYEATFANGEVFIREIERQTAENMPAVTLDGDWFDHPACLEPLTVEDERPVREAAE